MDADAMVAVRDAKAEVTRAWRHSEEGRAAIKAGAKAVPKLSTIFEEDKELLKKQKLQAKLGE